MNYAVLYGSTRSARKGIHVAQFMVNQLEARGHDVTLLDAKELALPFLDKMYKEYDGDAPAGMQRAHDVLDAADGLVVVGGEWNHSIPAALKNLLDHFQSEYAGKPAGIVTYSAGPFGGVRAAPHYRVILGELGMVTPSIMFAVSGVYKFESEDIGDDWVRRSERFLTELEWYTDALKAKREKDGNPY
ncbi:MAG: NADPH-dependent FMN reductase [Thermoplasmatota archaeon]